MSDGCMLCAAEPLTDRHYEDDDCWVGDCVVCMTPMVVWRTHGLPDADLETALLAHLERVAAARDEEHQEDRPGVVAHGAHRAMCPET